MNKKNSIKDLLDIQDINEVAGGGGGEKKHMSRDAASRIQSTACKNNSGFTPKNSFAARAMSAAYKNEPDTYQSNEEQAICPCSNFCTIL